MILNNDGIESIFLPPRILFRIVQYLIGLAFRFEIPAGLAKESFFSFTERSLFLPFKGTRCY